MNSNSFFFLFFSPLHVVVFVVLCGTAAYTLCATQKLVSSFHGENIMLFVVVVIPLLDGIRLKERSRRLGGLLVTCVTQGREFVPQLLSGLFLFFPS